MAAQGVPQGGTASLQNIVSVGLSLALIVGVILALFFLIWGGFDWVMSTGDKQKINNAQQKLLFSIIGLIVIFLSFFIMKIILNFFFGGASGAVRCGPGGVFCI